MNIWSSRTQSLAWLENDLMLEGKVLQEGFDCLESVGKIFRNVGEKEGESQTGQLCRVCAVTLAKCSHLLLGCYSLALDALAQESGALLRPFIESYELLVYFREDTSRIEEIFTDKLPSAGEIGRRIKGDYKGLREHLNSNAAHFSYEAESVRHLFDQNAKVTCLGN